ncbi:MAG TPA: hypothetical protein VEU08_16965 [Vicinamibacterales bacterium]|nr:hypothetical protein [Vicinamibacterales bacterium]
MEPDVEIRFTTLYAWLVVAFGAIFAVLGLLFAVINPRMLAFDVFMTIVGLAAAAGGNYWRQHVHVVARLTPKQLVLSRDGAIDWSEIVAMDKKTMRASQHGVRSQSEYVCIRLRTRRSADSKLQGFMQRLKGSITGYDIIVPDSELSCTADWFIAECRKRMAGTAGKA